MSLLSEKIAVVMPAKDEEPRIKDAILQFRGFVDEIVVVYEESNDKTKEIASKLADKIIEFNEKHDDWGLHMSEVYNFGVKQTECEYVLNPDVDERYPRSFLANIKKTCKFMASKNLFALQFPRLCLVTEQELKTLPKERLTKTEHGIVKDYPDYQMRLFFKDAVFWKPKPPHAHPFHRTEGIEIDKEGKPWCNTIKDAYIIHLPRRSDGITRPWW